MASATPFHIRPAQATDKEAVLAFCVHTFDWGDYLHEVWDEWLAAPQGKLLVATLDGVPVGVSKVTLLTSTEAWLEGLRVDERCRGQGLGWQLQSYCLNTAREWGAEVARLATHSRNLPVHVMCERAGMRHAASAFCLVAPSMTEQEHVPQLAPLGTQDEPQVVGRILHSRALQQMQGLYGAGWTWEALTEAKLRTHLEHGQVLALQEREERMAPVAIVSGLGPRWKVLPVALVEVGDSRAQMLAGALRHYAGTRGMDKVEVMIPVSSGLREAFVESGYENDLEADLAIRIYEKQLKGAT